MATLLYAPDIQLHNKNNTLYIDTVFKTELNRTDRSRFGNIPSILYVVQLRRTVSR